MSDDWLSKYKITFWKTAEEILFKLSDRNSKYYRLTHESGGDEQQQQNNNNNSKKKAKTFYTSRKCVDYVPDSYACYSCCSLFS